MPTEEASINKGPNNGSYRDDDHQEDRERLHAATTIQKFFREYRQRRKGPMNLDVKRANKENGSSSSNVGGENSDAASGGKVSSTSSPQLSTDRRWKEALGETQMVGTILRQNEAKNDPVSRWKRGKFYANRVIGSSIQSDDDESGDDNEEEAPKEDDVVNKLSNGNNKDNKSTMLSEKQSMKSIKLKEMEAAYWLEMVDLKHRYGSNLKPYHRYWNNAKTNENFFYWLDHGEGKHLSLPECDRAKLEEERILYLSAELRLNYRVNIGEDGLLHWQRNGVPVDTSKGRWKDLGHGRGIAEIGTEEVKAIEEEDQQAPPSDTESIASMASSLSSDSALSSGSSIGKDHAYKAEPWYKTTNARAIMDRMLRSTIKENTWIYVYDSKERLYVGIKKSGNFQHSSFVVGSQVISAGLIKAKNGKIVSLAPLSGHYRTGSEHFKRFVTMLEERGVDMNKVRISKSLYLLEVLEKYGRMKKRKEKLTENLQGALHVGHKRNGSRTDDKDNNVKNESNNMTDKERESIAIELLRSAFNKGLRVKEEGSEKS